MEELHYIMQYGVLMEGD